MSGYDEDNSFLGPVAVFLFRYNTNTAFYVFVFWCYLRFLTYNKNNIRNVHKM